MGSPAKQQLLGTGLGHSSHGSSQNKSVGSDTQGRYCGKPTAGTGEAARATGITPRAGPAFSGGRLGRTLRTALHQILLKCSKMEIKLVLSRTRQAAAIRRKRPILFPSAQ